MFFRPFIGEVLVGRIKSCDQTGLRVRPGFAPPPPPPRLLTLRRPPQITLGFFDDVHVPEECLQEPSELCVCAVCSARGATRFCVFRSRSDAPAAPCARSDEAEGLWRWRYEGQEEMFMDVDEEVRVRVKSLRFPERPASAEALALLLPLEGGMNSADGIAFAPMVVEVRLRCCASSPLPATLRGLSRAPRAG